jgi:hypothetical protein
MDVQGKAILKSQIVISSGRGGFLIRDFSLLSQEQNVYREGH